MNTAVFILLAFAAVASALGTAMVLKSLRAAPEGFEDADGFHYGDARAARQPAHALEHQTAA